MKNLNFGKKLVEVRKAKGLTQEELAERCRITVRTIQRIESGSVEPRAFTIKLISEVLGFDFFETANTGCAVDEKSDNSKVKVSHILWLIKDLFNLKTNVMKKISILSAFFLSVGFFTFFLVPGIHAKPTPEDKADPKPNRCFINTKDYLEVTFSNDLTLDSLVYIKNELKAIGMTINYRKLEFGEYNQLRYIDVELIEKNGKSSFTATLKNSTQRPGFFHDYRNGEFGAENSLKNYTPGETF